MLGQLKARVPLTAAFCKGLLQAPLDSERFVVLRSRQVKNSVLDLPASASGSQKSCVVKFTCLLCSCQKWEEPVSCPGGIQAPTVHAIEPSACNYSLDLCPSITGRVITFGLHLNCFSTCVFSPPCSCGETKAKQSHPQNTCTR